MGAADELMVVEVHPVYLIVVHVDIRIRQQRSIDPHILDLAIRINIAGAIRIPDIAGFGG